MAKPRPVAGDVQRAEDAENGDQLMGYTLNLEDAKYLDVQDKSDIAVFVDRAAQRIMLARRPCGFFARLFNRCELEGL